MMVNCKRNNKFVYIFFILAILPAFTYSRVQLPAFFSDGMILQQKTDVAIWGWAKPGIFVKITTSWNKKTYTIKTNDNGRWVSKLNTIAAGGPYNIIISDGDPVEIKNVLLGEVWLCSGQSNMEMPMKGFKDQPIKGSNDEIFNATNDQIRIYTIPRAVERHTKDTSKNSSWKTANPET